MSLPKTFSAGERLFASDLNDNFDYLEAAVEDAGPSFETAGTNTVAIDFSGDTIVTRSADSDVTFTGSNYTAGKSSTVRIVAGASARDLTFPSDWVFVSLKPASLPEGKIGILSATCFGSAATDVVVGWSDNE